jgi:hypothetical protein
MTTVTFMSTKHPVTFSVDDEVATRLFEFAKSKVKDKEPASKFVNQLLKWALDNYKEESNG